MIYLCILLSLLCTTAHAQKTAIGKPAPNYSKLEWVRPAAVQDHDFDSSVVILEFWATWCKPCMEHMPALVDIERRYAAKGVKVVAVSWDARPTQIDSFVKTHTMPAYVCIDRDNTMFLKTYKERGIPFAIMFGRDGRAVWEGMADSLTPQLIDTYLATNAVPPDPSEDERTVFSFSVQHSLPSDKSGIGTDYPVNSVLEIDVSSPAGLIVRTAQFLGLKHTKEDMSDDLPRGFYNLRLRFDPRLRSTAMRDRYLQQLDDFFGTRTTVEYRVRTVYTIELGHESSGAAVPTSTSGAATTMRLYNAIGIVERNCGMEVIVDDAAIGERMVRFPTTVSDWETAVEELEQCGFRVRKEDRSLPTIVIRRAEQ